MAKSLYALQFRANMNHEISFLSLSLLFFLSYASVKVFCSMLLLMYVV